MFSFSFALLSRVQGVVLLLGILVATLLGLVAWGFVQARRNPTDMASPEPGHDLLLWSLVLAAFTLGIFLAYVLLVFPGR